MRTGHRVLIVDDDDDARNATARVLSRAGYATQQAGDGAQALALASTLAPHLVLLDVKLPDLDSLEVLRRLRADPGCAASTVVFMSSEFIAPEEQASGLDAGAEDYIARPLSDGELLARVRALLRQRDLTDELRASEQRFRSLVAGQADGVLVVDIDGIVRFANSAAQALLDRDASKLEGSAFGLPVSETEVTDVELRHPGGASRAAEMRAAAVQWDGADAWVVSLRDVSDRASLEEQLRRSQRLESLGQLTGGVAHDFNNLLTVILGNAELLAEAPSTDQARLRAVSDTIARAAERGAQLTARLLAFARQQVLEPRALDVNELLHGMEQMVHRTLGEDIAIHLEAFPDLWPALVDPAQLENALLNLCLNARDAMPRGGRLTLETRNAELDEHYASQHLEVAPGEYVRIAVSDTGSGMTAHVLERMFEPFFTTKSAGKGTGLGLAMVYGFIKQSNGHLSVYSEAGEGTSVKLYLPRALATAAARETPRKDAMPHGNGELILAVEDDDLVREYTCTQLRRLGYQVLEAGNAAQALDLLRARDDVQLLFTDVVMPGGMSGRELADAAQALRPRLAVLYTSGYTENAIVHHGRLDPGVHLLSKPYRVTELARRVHEMLR